MLLYRALKNFIYFENESDMMNNYSHISSPGVFNERIRHST